MVTNREPKRNTSNVNGSIVKRLIQVLIQILMFGVILFVSAGRIDWPWAWIYLGVFIIIVTINSIILPPDLISERGQSKENVKKWDKIITSVSAIPALGMLVVAGLDLRFGWSPQTPIWMAVSGLVFMVLGNAFFSWAMISNYFFSTTVRIQIDRDHTVASGGPYRFVRHPGYVGFIVSNLATPFILGSLWALTAAIVTAILFILRTALEDRTLQKELGGYRKYAEKVRYRLLPGIW